MKPRYYLETGGPIPSGMKVCLNKRYPAKLVHEGEGYQAFIICDEDGDIEWIHVSEYTKQAEGWSCVLDKSS